MTKSDRSLDGVTSGNHVGMIAHWLESYICRNLARGRLRLSLPDGETVCACASEEPNVDLRIDDWRTILLIFIYPSYYLPDALVRRRVMFNIGTMDDLLRMVMSFPEIPPPLPLRERFLRSAGAWADKIFGAGSERRANSDVKFHYNLSNEFFRSFLDEHMQYSCAFFDPWNIDLDEAQLRKMSLIRRKLNIPSKSRVLDIGCGWGGLAKFIASGHDASVTGITLSDQQQIFACSENQLENVRFELCDYRMHSSVYDRIVSVGMLEHVGRDHFKEYFGHIRRLLSADGVALIHSIGRAAQGGPINPWLRKSIFPGSYLPQLSELISAAEENNLWIIDVDNWRLHYAQTLSHWLDRVERRRTDIVSTFGEEFYLAWRFYLRSCELGFLHQGLTVYQVLVARRPNAVPLNRQFMYDAQAI